VNKAVYTVRATGTCYSRRLRYGHTLTYCALLLFETRKLTYKTTHMLNTTSTTQPITSSFYSQETSRICDFLANCCAYTRKQNKAPFFVSPEVYKTSSKTGSGIRILYLGLLAGPITRTAFVPPGLPSRTIARTVSSELISLFFSCFSIFVSVPCAISWLFRQLLSARKYHIVSYRKQNKAPFPCHRKFTKYRVKRDRG